MKWKGTFEFYLWPQSFYHLYPNAITEDGIQHVLNMMVGDENRPFDTIVISNEDGTETASKVIVPEVLSGRLRSTVMFDHTEGNCPIAEVQMWADTVLIAETEVNIVKTDKQSLTIVRTDKLEGDTA